MIYQPSDDSYLLKEQALKYSKRKRILDMGSGSGILAEAALKGGAKEVIASDINIAAVRSLEKKGIKAIKSDLFSNIKGKFDVIIFNPPYLPYDKKEDSMSRRITTGGKRGDEIILRFLRNFKMHLENGGYALIVISTLTPRSNIENVLMRKNLKREILKEKKLFMEKLEVWKIMTNEK